MIKLPLIFVCDRCKREQKTEACVYTYDLDENLSLDSLLAKSLPDGWKYSEHGTLVVCPECG